MAVLSLILAALAILLGACSQEDQRGNQNVILIVVDTLRNDRQEFLTSQLESMVEEGFCFQNACAASTWTKPSVASLLTGLYPGRHGAIGSLKFRQQNILLSPDHVTLSERLQAEGYRTAGFVTNPNLSHACLFDQGFDTYVQPAGEAEELVKRSIAWLDTLEKDRKFFIYLHIIDPHTPYYPPAAYRSEMEIQDLGPKALYTNRGSPMEVKAWIQQYSAWARGARTEPFQFDIEVVKTWLRTRNEEEKKLVGDLETLQERIFFDFTGKDDPLLKQRATYLTGLYDQEVRYSFDALHGLMEALQARELLDPSILIFTGDHGEGFLEHDCWGHGNNLHSEELNVPLIIKARGADGWLTGKHPEPVSLVDIYPTVLDMLGLAQPPGMDGCSLYPLMKDPLKTRGKPVLAEVFNKDSDQAAIVLRDRKVIRIEQEGQLPVWVSYDLAQDPLEKEPIPFLPGPPEEKYLFQYLSKYLNERRLNEYGGAPDKPLSEEEVEQLHKLGYL